MPTFTTPEPISAVIQLAVGDATIAATDRDDTVVQVRPSDPTRDADVRAAEQTRVEYTSGRLVVRAPRPRVLWGKAGSVDVTIELPAGSDLEADASVAAVRATGALGDCRIKTSTGDVRLDETRTTTVGTGAGAVTIEHVDGDAQVSTGSGRIEVRSIAGNAVVKNSNGHNRIGTVTGSLRTKTANGDIVVGGVGHDVEAATANGDIRIGEIARGAANLRTARGEIEIGIRSGTAARLDVHTTFGKVQNLLAETAGPASTDDSVEIQAHTGFGDILVRRATPNQPTSDKAE
ncbi:DUF4097 and DUF4098 domain-containing protein YvlB [Rhodococcus sp. LBL1]|uniref:DUF4097 and DUF4098 domain-containing protein YvlB n=1 Tax=Prescottella agglutinans TaxID=1644129 RepID=A0ABT6M9R5_9NOCA|nr:DUF4097 family beta strand repeat-containing protein [Prescottella agglutinans]MDH6281044.1 DUF4097 and DUF4098 domain-containing protein YvlB [Prescottella agglutinans]MDH6676315.1 DUF4097 and DUF4098 domain-containing protein YvlB [Rhodococcus sp. LBL1]MDH6681601.1 DUF4097 and DUF4098 domain-containing protein YvlB [Rhodococcus sp. LBL2]